MGLFAAAMFVSLYAFGGQAFGWESANGNIEIGLFLSFILGIIAGYRVRS